MSNVTWKKLKAEKKRIKKEIKSFQINMGINSKFSCKEIVEAIRNA